MYTSPQSHFTLQLRELSKQGTILDTLRRNSFLWLPGVGKKIKALNFTHNKKHEVCSHTIFNICLVGGFKPKTMSKSQLGLFFPTEWKHKIHVPNHQPDFVQQCAHKSNNGLAIAISPELAFRGSSHVEPKSISHLS